MDAGAGNAPYKSLFTHTRYECADFEQIDKPYLTPTYSCDLAHLPVEDHRFDAVLFTQVMEHLPDPLAVLRELHRVLKPGGRLLYSGPLFYEEHEQPYDYYRYTQFGLRYLFAQAKFEVQRLDWLEGYFGTLAYQLASVSAYLPGDRHNYGGGGIGLVAAVIGRILRVACRIGSPLLHRLEMRHKLTTLGYPKNYVAILTPQ